MAMFTVADRWDKYFSGSRGKPERVMSEEAIVRNCLHMLLGLKTDVFRTTPEHVVYVNSEFLSACNCPHLSPNAMKTILKEIARIATHVNLLRVTVTKHRVLHGEAADVIATKGRRLLDVLDVWTRHEIRKRGLTLIELCHHLRTCVRDVRTFLSLVDAFSSAVSFDELRSTHFCLGNVSETNMLLQNNLKCIIRESNVRDDSSLLINAEDLLSPSDCEKRLDESAIEVACKLVDEEPEKTFFICYIHSNRILSY